MRPVAALPAAALTGVVLLAIAWGSAVELPHHGEGVAQLRLSWSARPERVETCRAVSEEEQARLAPHMRRSVECEGEPASYLLVVVVDDDSLEHKVIRGGGMRNDRPIHLLQNYQVVPGQHRVVVSMTRREAAVDATPLEEASAIVRSDTGLFAGRAERESIERSRRNSSAIPEALVLDTTITFVPARIALVTFDADSRVLKLTTNSPGQR